MAKSGRRVRVQVGDVEVKLRLTGDVSGLPPAEEWLFFGPVEGRVVELLLGGEPLSREEIAVKLDESSDGRLKGVLAGLVARHVLRVEAGGYAPNCISGRRESLLRWVRHAGEQAG